MHTRATRVYTCACVHHFLTGQFCSFVANRDVQGVSVYTKCEGQQQKGRGLISGYRGNLLACMCIDGVRHMQVHEIADLDENV